ncbi:MAG: M48 family metallopeptidase [Bifidobacteriaceae bacterium]|jgi:predicted metal-dependent hydrolase|nr:M48 family metallopeptidase [Bifidobacteriaceae bacterium]
MTTADHVWPGGAARDDSYQPPQEQPTPEDLDDPCWRASHYPYCDDPWYEEDADGFNSFDEYEEELELERRLRRAMALAAARYRPQGVVTRETIEIDGLQVELRRKAMVSLRLHVEPSGLIWLSMPYRTSREEAVAMFRKHRRWVDQMLQRVSAPRPEPQLWGSPAPPDLPGAALDRLYRRELSRKLPELAARWIPLVGQGPSMWTLRWMTSRWGSCSSHTRRITLNLALAALPERCLEEVLVHELVHLVEPNHGPGFAAWMDHLLPDWRATRTDMRKTKPMLRPV